MIYKIRREKGDLEERFSTGDMVRQGCLQAYIDDLAKKARRADPDAPPNQNYPYLRLYHIIDNQGHRSLQRAVEVTVDPEQLFNSVGEELQFGLLTEPNDIKDERWILTVTTVADDSFESAVKERRGELTSQGWTSLTLAV